MTLRPAGVIDALARPDELRRVIGDVRQIRKVSLRDESDIHTKTPRPILTRSGPSGACYYCSVTSKVSQPSDVISAEWPSVLTRA